MKLKPKWPQCFWLLAGVAAVVGGCRHAPVAKAGPEGRSAFRFVEDADASLAAGTTAAITTGPRQPVDVRVPAEPIQPLAEPEYPRAARGGQSGPALVGVRITVDATGRVVDVGPSLRAISTPGPWAAEFRAAVEAAVAQWRFTPAEIRRLVPGRGGPQQEDYWVVTRAEKTDATFDVAFTFTAAGDVLPGAVP